MAIVKGDIMRATGCLCLLALSYIDIMCIYHTCILRSRDQVGSFLKIIKVAGEEILKQGAVLVFWVDNLLHENL